MDVNVKIKLVSGGKMPEYKTVGAACADCYARYTPNLMVQIPDGDRVKIPLGFCLELPVGYKASIKPRSGLSLIEREDVILGTIDSDYRGEVCAIFINNSGHEITLKNGDRICQMEIGPAYRAVFELCDELSDSDRGNGGFGSTGK